MESDNWKTISYMFATDLGLLEGILPLSSKHQEAFLEPHVNAITFNPTGPFGLRVAEIVARLTNLPTRSQFLEACPIPKPLEVP